MLVNTASRGSTMIPRKAFVSICLDELGLFLVRQLPTGSYAGALPTETMGHLRDTEAL